MRKPAGGDYNDKGKGMKGATVMRAGMKSKRGAAGGDYSVKGSQSGGNVRRGS